AHGQDRRRRVDFGGPLAIKRLPRPRVPSRGRIPFCRHLFSGTNAVDAVVKTGGKQYRVRPGGVLVVEKLAGEPGQKVAFDQVLMVGEGEAVTVGAPVVAD